MSEEKKDALEAHIHAMEKKNMAIVQFKNITKEDFNHAYHGHMNYIKAGETVPLQYDAAMLLGKHLAMRILREKAHAQGDKDKDKINLYSDKVIADLRTTMFVEVIQRDAEAHISEAEKEKIKAQKIKQEFGKKKQGEEKVTPKPDDDKKEIIKELEKRKHIKFKKRAGKKELLDLLMADETNPGGDKK